MECNNVWNSGGSDFVCAPSETNFSDDPRFCDPKGQDYTLGSDSPCSPALSPDGCDLIGAFDVGCSPVPVLEMTWGSIKNHFR